MASKLFIVRPAMGAGGAEKTTLTLLQKLDRNLFDLTLVLMKRQGEFLAEVPSNVQVISLNASSLWTVWLPLARLIAQQKPDIIFSPGGTDIAVILARILSRHTCRVVVSERNTLVHGALTWKRRAMILLKRIFFRWADAITAVSQGVKDDMVEKLRIAPERIKVVYNPVVDEQMLELAKQPIDHAWFAESTPIILGVGRLVPQKDFETLIRAFAQVRQTHPARLVILGEGPLRANLQTLAESLGVAQDVWLAGFQKNPFKFMARATMFVLSSLHEGLPGALIQAMACGAPAISTDCPFGPSEIIRQSGQDGILIPVHDVQSLARQIVYLLNNAAIRQSMSVKGKQSAERFHVRTAVPQFESVLRAAS